MHGRPKAGVDMTELKLHDYQERAVDFVLKNKAAYLAIDLGMGKTAIALETIKRSGQKAFVFGPLRTIYSSWPDEIKKWAPELSYYICHGPEKSIVGLENCDIILMNYEGLNWLAKQKGRWTKRMVIYDESSMVKSHSTARFKMLQKMSLLFWTEYRICLSATPAPNSLAELWSQYYLLDGGRALGANITSFRRDFCTPYSYPGMSVTLYKVDPRFERDIYKRVGQSTFRLEANDYLDMPDITYNRIPCELPAKARKQYKELEQEFFLELDEVEVEAPNTALLGMKLRQFVQGGLYDEEKKWHRIHNVKLQALKELMETSAGQSILCPIQFKGELAVLRESFGSDLPVIAGGTSAVQAKHYIDSWNAGDLPLLCCHPASISHGVNLQSGGHIILWYGLTWSLEQYLQLNGRLHRQGQQSAVFIHHLVMSGTIDEVVMKALATKNTSQRKLLNYLKEYRHESL